MKFCHLSCLLPALALAAPQKAQSGVDIRTPGLGPALQKRQYTQNTTDSQLFDGTPCRALTLIFARGTFEGGNVGGVVGPPLAQALVNLTGVDNLAVQGVDYPANVTGFLLGGDPAGSVTMAQYINYAYTRCPNTKLAISGYSQGAQLVHNAAALLNSSVTDFVNSVVTFGDPYETRSVGNIPSSKVKIFCAEGDDICTGGYTITNAHLSYGANATQAAQFIYGLSGLGNNTGTTTPTTSTTTGSKASGSGVVSSLATTKSTLISSLSRTTASSTKAASGVVSSVATTVKTTVSGGAPSSGLTTLKTTTVSNGVSSAGLTTSKASGTASGGSSIKPTGSGSSIVASSTTPKPTSSSKPTKPCSWLSWPPCGVSWP